MATDITKWKLLVDNGRQVWQHDEGHQQNFIEKYLLGQDINGDAPALDPPQSVFESYQNAITFYERLQCEDGHWANDYGGPMFLMPGLVITCYITGFELEAEQKLEMIRYLQNQQRKDGGWGLHIESPSTIFGTALNYAAIRMLGMGPEEETAKRAREFLLSQGGAAGIPSWGKFWLAVAGLYEWDGLNPILPEFWLLPYWVPLHPGRFWCHCRMVYLPMGYLYGRRYQAEITPLIESLRSEMYTTPYDKVNWPSMPNNVSPLDLYTPHSWLVNTMHWVQKKYNTYHSAYLREQALNECMRLIHLEDADTKYIDIGPVNKVINMLCVWVDEVGRYPLAERPARLAASDRFRRHCDRVGDYLWLAQDGMKMQGYNGSQLWDTAFSLQAILSTGAIATEEFPSVLVSGYRYLESTQVRQEVDEPDSHYRHKSVGAWPFSTRDHGWPISDCTAEGLKATLLLHQAFHLTPQQRGLPAAKDAKLQPAREQIEEVLIDNERVFQAVDVMLSLQNKESGGWATYELKRGGSWIEYLNPSETFHGIMVDYPYVECTSACVQALCMFQGQYPRHRSVEVATAIQTGVEFIRKIQRKDGSWKGSWGVCFTYAIWFGIEGLIAAGEPSNAPEIKKAVQFLLSKQREDGGWGEDFQSCVKMDWVDNPDGSQVVNTSWAVLSLLAANAELDPILRGVRYLRSKQLPNGDWTQESISGVFNANCAISYSGYKNIFPIWALGKFYQMYPNLLNA